MEAKKRDRLSEVAASEHLRVAGDPNIVAVGMGLRQRGGKAEYEVCVQYHVRTKIAREEEIRQMGSAPIPTNVGGYPTDVIEVKRARAHKNEGPPTGSRGSHSDNPLVGGGSTTVLSDWHSIPTGFGTLGGICFDASNGDPMAISNAHVWGPDTGKDCIQPWIPTGQYIGASLELLTCGPLAFILDTTLPSPLTAGLAAAAAAAWIAAAASDSEDPSRWGQRVGAIPPPGAKTTGETIRLAADVPPAPFAGRAYTTKASWDYTRHTTSGDTSNSITEDRANQQLVEGKLAWTERDEYRPGERVQICAEILSSTVSTPQGYYVVANCFPLSQPDRIVYRVLQPGSGRCKGYEAKPVCLRGFPDPLPLAVGSGTAFPIAPFWFESGDRPAPKAAPPGTQLAGLNLLTIPATSLRIVFPPCTRVELEVVEPKNPVTVIARNSAGVKVATVTGTGGSPNPETLVLTAGEMVEVVISNSRGDSLLAGICTSKQPGQATNENVHRLFYNGTLDLDLQEKKDQWNITLTVQKINPASVGADPIQAAANFGGVVAGAGILVVACITVMVLDHVFHVF